jgi:hypothetical protein
VLIISAVYMSDFVSNDRTLMDKFEKIWDETSVIESTYYPGTCLQRLRGTMMPRLRLKPIAFRIQIYSVTATATCLVWRSVADFPPRRPGFEPMSGHVGFVVDKVALG